MRTQAVLLCAILVIALTTLAALTDAEFVPSDSIQSDSVEQIVKRPFCNAFTGCGRKRSDTVDSDTVYDPTDLLLQKLGQQILREAKLRGGLQTKLDMLALRNRLKSIPQGQIRGTPWLEYLTDRKKRMAASVDTFEDRTDAESS